MPGLSRGHVYGGVLCLLVWGSLSACGVARAAEEDPAPKPAREEQPRAAADPTAEPHITIVLGSMRQTVEGNPQRFRQYVTPPTALHIARLEVDHPLNEDGLVFGAQAHDLFEASAGGSGYLYEVDEGLRVDTRYRRSEFFRDPYAGASHLTRKDWRTDARWRVTPSDHLIGGYAVTELRSSEEAWRRENWRGQYTRRLGSLEGYAGLNFERFSFGTGSPYFSGETATWTVGFAPSRDAQTLVAGVVSGTNTNLDGVALSPTETSAALSGFRQVTDDLTITGDLKFWELTDSIAQNAYARRELLGAVEGEYAGLPRTVIRAGFESAQVDYVNGRQSQVVEPAVNTTSVSLRARPIDTIKVQADWRRRRVDDRPLAYTVGGFPTTTLIYSQTDRVRARVTWTPTFAPIGLTAGYQDDDRENENRGVSSNLVTRDLSAWWNITDDVSATVSLLDQDFDLSGVGNATALQTNAESWSVGASWRLSRRTNLEAGFQRADSFGGIELAQKIWSASLEHKWHEHTVRLGMTLDDLDDYNGTLLGYDADLWYAQFSTRLP